MSEDIKKEIKNELEKGHFMVLKSYNENDDIEFHKVFSYQDTLLAKRAVGDPVPVDSVLKRNLVEMYVTDEEEYAKELMQEEVV